MSQPLVKLDWDLEGTFRDRPNRFLSLVDIEAGEEGVLQGEKVHVHDPGRLRELLYPGNRVLVKRASNPNRKTRWDLVAAQNDGDWIVVNSAYHRGIAEAILEDPAISPFGQLESFKAEVKLGKSRLDFVLTREDGRETAVEVKGCTLTVESKALFPDAPTERGTRHLDELRELALAGEMGAAVLILVFRPDSECFAPFEERDPKFAEAFRKAVEAGVEVHPLLLEYDGEQVRFQRKIPVCEDFL